MIRKFFVAASIGAAIVAAGSLAPSRASAMPMGLPADIADPINAGDLLALCFYLDGWGGRVVIRGGGGGRGHIGRGGGGGGGRGGHGGGRRH